jgi:predicted ATPase
MPPFAIPATLRASLAERVDRVAAARPIAAIGAAIGRQFSYALIQAVCDLSDIELQAALARLVDAGLVLQRGAPPDAVYSFKHALVQDAAHDSLLRDDRRQLHARIAAALETGFSELTEGLPEILAQHYAEAGLAERSAACWSKAGRRSAAHSAMVEAAAQFQKGIEQLALLPSSRERQRLELELQSALGAALQAIKGFAASETGRVYARARELWERLDFPVAFRQVVYAQSIYHTYRREFELAQRVNADLLERSRQRGDTAGLVLGHNAAGCTLMYVGNFAVSRAHLEAALALYDPVAHGALVHQAGVHPPSVSQAHLGIVLFSLGFSDQALARSNASIAEARHLAHYPSLAGSLSLGNILLSLLGEDAALDEQASELVALASEQKFPLYRASAASYRGWVKLQRGEATEGLALMRRASSAFRATGMGTEAYRASLLARACAAAGQIGEAGRLLDEALEAGQKSGEGVFAAELHRHKGELLLRQGDAEAAAELYSEALSVAREQQAKMWELRACVSLARLWRDRGRSAHARDLLAPVYGWFSEGFGTADLREAKALLDELA